MSGNIKALLISITMMVWLVFGCKTTRLPSTPVVSQTRQDYIAKYSNLAISEMKRTGVPASITMAQALLESGDGNSTLARNSNNHFGIKCHNDWKGPTYRYDDDRRRECFRKYASVADSYRDHSDFLREKSRYEFLFDLDVTDYKEWSKGLKKAGYATNPKYAALLIKIIEENNLSRLDEGIILAGEQTVNPATGVSSNSIDRQNSELFEQDFAISASGQPVREINRVEYIVAREGDTFNSLTREYGLMPWELPRYNDLEDTAVIQPGWILFMQPKRNQAEQGYSFHVVRDGDTPWSISQMYGIKLSRILEINSLTPGEPLKPGQRVWLRKQRIP